MSLAAVIFDKDGVLVNSERGKCKAMAQALELFGHTNVMGFDEWFFSRVGTPGLESCEMCVAHFRFGDVDAKALYDEGERIRREVISKEPAPLIIEGLEFLRQAHSIGLKIGVASSDFPDNIRKHMEQAGVLEYISAITSGEKHSGEVTRDKPHPDVYLVTARKLGVEPRACIGIEDTTPGIMAVKAAGMYCVGYRNPLSGKQDYSGADMTTDDLRTVNLATLCKEL